MLTINKGINLKEYIEEIIFNHLLIENGNVNEQQDHLIEKNLNNTFIEYILSTNSESKDSKINKYHVGNYYTELARQFNRIAVQRKISRNNLWKMIKENIIFKNSNKTELRLYKYIFRGEIIPSPRYVYKTLLKHEYLPSYISIAYLGEVIEPELKSAYEKISIT